MATSLKDKMKKIGARRRRRIETRADELIAEELSLGDLRRAHALTQERMAEFLGVGQDGVSRLEKRSDLLLSTLRGYVEAMGGRLRLIAEFPDRPPVVLGGLSDVEQAVPSRPRVGAPRRSRP